MAPRAPPVDGVVDSRGRPRGTACQARAAYLLRRRFGVSGRPRRAQVFATALGTYELAVNGAKAGDELMRPGWTDYRRRAQYQMVDVTELLGPGDNVIGAILAPGWYGGRIGSQEPTGSGEPVPVPEFLCQLELELDDGDVRHHRHRRAMGMAPVGHRLERPL